MCIFFLLIWFYDIYVFMLFECLLLTFIRYSFSYTELNTKQNILLGQNKTK